MKIAEWPSPSVNLINFRAHLCGLLTKKLSQESIWKPCGSDETLEETSSSSNKYTISPSRHWTNMGYPQKHRAQRSALFNLNKCAKLCIVTQECERLRCMVLLNLVKIITLKVKWNISYLIITYTKKLGQIPTVLVTAGNRGWKPPRPGLELFLD